jgi:dehydrogenase/reductase SDR family protein 12
MSPDLTNQTSPFQPAALLDGLLEASIVGSFTKLGYLARRRLWRWSDPPSLRGKVIVVTGASSGIGRATAIDLSRLGAELWLVGRDQSRLERTRDEARAAGEAAPIHVAAANVIDPLAVESLVERIGRSVDRLDGLVHSAGALFPHYALDPNGTELTVATHVLAPFRLSYLLSPLLRRTGRSVIVTVASGGMYTQRFALNQLEMSADEYRGVTAYARAKRAQVELAHGWERRWGDDGVASYSMHPGWVDTPGLQDGLPSVARLGPLLRTPQQGADTVVWLAADGPRSSVATAEEGRSSGGFWLDRRRRGEHYLKRTRTGPEETLRNEDLLWQWCASRTGLDLPGDRIAR